MVEKKLSAEKREFIEKLQENCISGDSEKFVRVRRENEHKALHILKVTRGNITKDTFLRFYEYWNTEYLLCKLHNYKEVLPLRNETITRFEPIHLTIQKIYNEENICYRDVCAWHSSLWEKIKRGSECECSDLRKIICEEYDKTNIKYVRPVIFSVIMYLRFPDIFNVTSEHLQKGLHWLTGVEINVKSGQEYLEYNDAVTGLRKECNLCPQEVDYILSCAKRKADEEEKARKAKEQ